MLITSTNQSPQAEARNTSARTMRRERKLWDHPSLTPSLGCFGCKQFGECGGLRTTSQLLDCMGLCCGNPEGCTKVCRKKPADFVARVREIGGFPLMNTPRGPILRPPPLPTMVPLIYHGNRRAAAYGGGVVVLPMYALLKKPSGDLKFTSRAALCDAFKIAHDATIILTGTALDPPLERWWKHGQEKTDEIVRGFKALGIAMVSTPNYSLFANVPRFDDLHSMKRIALTFAQFVNGGMPTALHVNGRTEQDFRRWAAFVRERPEITALAYEFGTGAGRAGRSKQHADWLIGLACAVDRPLHLLVRGGLDVAPLLAEAFDQVTIIETSAFMKTMNRQRAVPAGNASVKWQPAPTESGEALDQLLAYNVGMLAEMVGLLAAPPLKPKLVSAA